MTQIIVDTIVPVGATPSMEKKRYWSNTQMEKKQARKAGGLPAIWENGGEAVRRVRAGPTHMDEWVDCVAPGEKVVGIVIDVPGSGLWLRLLADAGYVHIKSFPFDRAAGNAGGDAPSYD